MKLKQDENGNTVQVIKNIQINEIQFGSDDIKRQISQHAEIIQDLQLQLQAVLAFESNNLATQEVIISSTIDNPIIDEPVLATVTEIEVPPPIEPVIV